MLDENGRKTETAFRVEEKERDAMMPRLLRLIYIAPRSWAVRRFSGKKHERRLKDGPKGKTNPPNPVGKYKTHGYAAVLEQPGLFRNAAEKLGHELFTVNGLGYMRDEMQLGVY